MPLGRRLVRVVLTAAATLLVAAPSASAIDPVDTSALRDAVTVNGILRHERALQGIANMNGGTRVAGSPGHTASATYVKDGSRARATRSAMQEFEFPYFQELAAPALSRTAPTPKDYVADTDVATLEYSGAGDVTAPLVAVDLVLPPGPTANSNTSGCETADWAGFPRGAIALVQRGTCTFQIKVANAEAAGAVGIILFNEGTPGAPDRNGLPAVTLGRPFTIPALGATFAVGNELAALVAAGPVESAHDDEHALRDAHDDERARRHAGRRRVRDRSRRRPSRLASPRARASTTTGRAPRRSSPSPRRCTG